MSDARRRIVVGPFNRVEGDLEVTLDIDDGRVAAAYVNAPLYRGFEQIPGQQDPRDALVIAPRIWHRSVSQSMAAAMRWPTPSDWRCRAMATWRPTWCWRPRTSPIISPTSTCSSCLTLHVRYASEPGTPAWRSLHRHRR